MAKYSLNPFTVKQYGSFRLHQNHQRNPSLTMIIVTSCLLVLLFLLFGYCLKQNLNAWIISSNVTNVITAETAAETTRTTASLSSSSPEILNLPLKTFVPLELSSGGGRLLSSEHQNHHHEPHAEMKEDAVLDSDDLRTTTYNETAFDEDDDVDDDHRDDVGISHYDHHQDLDHQFDDVSLKKSSKNERFKRSVLGLASMIRCIARCNPLSYKNYGCFCGFQGEGRPVDPIDKCCYMHDLCYTRTDCNQVLVYFVSYKWLCHNNGRASCGYMVNGNSSEQCGYQLCECDRRFAKCLSRYRCPKGKPSCRTKRNTIMDFAKLFSI